LAAFLWVLAPTFSLFAFTLDALIAAGVAWTLFLCARGLCGSARSSMIYAALAGIGLALTSFVSLGALAASAILVFAALMLRRRAALKFLLVGVIAFFATWAIMAVWGGFDPLLIMRQALDAHELATLRSRTHAPWALMNVLMWALSPDGR
jgi:hypothetical protein